MVIEIRITPRKIERFFFLVLLIAAIGAAVYYNVQVTDLRNEAVITAQVVVDLKTELEAKPEPAPVVVQPEPAPPEPEPEPEPKKPVLSGRFDVQVPPIKYDVVESGDFVKAKIEKISFIIENGLDYNVAPSIKIYAFDRNSAESHKYYPKYTVHHPTVGSGSKVARTFEVQNLNLYNFDLAKTIRFEVYDSEDFLIAQISKTLHLEE